MLSTDFSTKLHRYFNYSCENTSAVNKGLECTIAYNNIESMFLGHFLYQLCCKEDPFLSNLKVSPPVDHDSTTN